MAHFYPIQNLIYVSHYSSTLSEPLSFFFPQGKSLVNCLFSQGCGPQFSHRPDDLSFTSKSFYRRLKILKVNVFMMTCACWQNGIFWLGLLNAVQSLRPSHIINSDLRTFNDHLALFCFHFYPSQKSTRKIYLLSKVRKRFCLKERETTKRATN